MLNKFLAIVIFRFDYFGEILEQTLSGLQYLKDRCNHEGFDSFYTKFQQFAHYFLYYSIIVSRQPPSVVIKCGDAENHRRSRFWFNTEIRYSFFLKKLIHSFQKEKKKKKESF